MINAHYENEKDLKNLINYAVREDKCENGVYGAQGVIKDTPDSMYRQMLDIQTFYRKEKGRRAIHFVLSFSKLEERFIGEREALMIGYAIADLYKDKQILFAVHTNTDNLHIHFIMNPVSYVDGVKFTSSILELDNIKASISRIVEDLYFKKVLGKTRFEMKWDGMSYVELVKVYYPCK